MEMVQWKGTIVLPGHDQSVTKGQVGVGHAKERVTIEVVS